MYDSDMKAYIEHQTRIGRAEHAQETQHEVRLMKQWKAESKWIGNKRPLQENRQSQDS
jgi:hypothetical protein